MIVKVYMRGSVCRRVCLALCMRVCLGMFACVYVGLCECVYVSECVLCVGILVTMRMSVFIEGGYMGVYAYECVYV